MLLGDERRILHADLDAFYAAVEQRDRAELRGQPVIVGGRAEDRGVVATASYEARRFGVHSAMPTRTALRLCPQAVLIPPDFLKYRTISRQVLTIYHTWNGRTWTPLVEPVALDEAYLDLTPGVASFEEAVAAAQAIRQRVRREARLRVSVGVGTSKLVAKIASGLAKPDGLRAVPPGTEREFLWPLSVGHISGIGPKSVAGLRYLGVETIGDLAGRSPAELAARFGRLGRLWHGLAQGIDPRPVEPERPVQQVSRETTFPQDVADAPVARQALERLAERVAETLQERGLRGRTVTVKLRFADFRTLTRQVTLPQATHDVTSIITEGQRLIDASWEPGQRLRLLGIGVSHFELREARQLPLFGGAEDLSP